jgi:hypothetical protein
LQSTEYRLFTEQSVENTMEAYRSGHNGPDSKSGRPQGLVGSNPTLSATIVLKVRTFRTFRTFLCLFSHCFPHFGGNRGKRICGFSKLFLQENCKMGKSSATLRGFEPSESLFRFFVLVVLRIIIPQYVSSHFQVILKENGLRKIRFHDLRHSCASLLLANNIPMKMIQDWLGHSDMATTANIYSHIDSSSKLASANMIEEVLGVTEDEIRPPKASTHMYSEYFLS